MEIKASSLASFEWVVQKSSTGVRRCKIWPQRTEWSCSSHSNAWCKLFAEIAAAAALQARVLAAWSSCYRVSILRLSQLRHGNNSNAVAYASRADGTELSWHRWACWDHSMAEWKQTDGGPVGCLAESKTAEMLCFKSLGSLRCLKWVKKWVAKVGQETWFVCMPIGCESHQILKNWDRLINVSHFTKMAEVSWK